MNYFELRGYTKEESLKLINLCNELNIHYHIMYQVLGKSINYISLGEYVRTNANNYLKLHNKPMRRKFKKRRINKWEKS